MNQELQDFARKSLLDGLSQLPEKCHELFKLMYGRNGGKRSVEDAKAMTLSAVVGEIPDTSLDWAMQQVQNTISKEVPNA